MAYVYEPYPKWLYFEGGRKAIVKDAAAHKLEAAKAGGRCWESPADVPQDAPAAAPVAPPPAAAPVPVKVNEVVAGIAHEASIAIGKFYSAPAKLVIERISMTDSVDDLREIASIEGNRPQGARKTVMEAVAKQIAYVIEQSVRRDEAAADDDSPSTIP